MKKILIFSLFLLLSATTFAQQNLFDKPLQNWRNDPRDSTSVNGLATILNSSSIGKTLYDYQRKQTRVWNGSSWQILVDRASIATVATSGSYLDLSNRPALFSGSYVDLTNKPTFATVATTGNYNDLSNKPTIPNFSAITNNYIPIYNAGNFQNSPINLQADQYSNGNGTFTNFNKLVIGITTSPNPRPQDAYALEVNNNAKISNNLSVTGVISSNGLANTGNITNTGTITTATLAVTGVFDVGALAQFNNNIAMSPGTQITATNLLLGGKLTFPSTNSSGEMVNGIVNSVRTLSVINTEDASGLVLNYIPSERAVRAAIDAATTPENGLSLVSGKIRLGGTLLAGNTDIQNFSTSALRIRNTANTASNYSFGQATFNVGDQPAALLVNSVFNGTLSTFGNLSVNGLFSVTAASGNTSVGGTLTVTGATTFNNNVSLAATRTLTVGTGATTLGGTLAVTGTQTFTGATTHNGATSVTGTNTFTVGTGATTLGGTLAVTGATTLTGALTTNGGILAGSQRIQNVLNPTAAQDAATKNYVDNAISTAVYRSIQQQRRTGVVTSGYYNNTSATQNLSYVGIDCPDVVLKNSTSYVDTWTKLAAPPIATAATSVTTTSFVANWGADTYWNGTAFVAEPATSYTLQYSTSSTFASAVTTVTDIATTSFTITGLTTATTYYYRVALVNGNTVSNYSNTITRITN